MNKTQLPPHLPETLKALRIFSNYSQKYISSILSVKQSTVSDLENVIIKPCNEKLSAISALYEISIEDLLLLAKQSPRDNITIALNYLKSNGAAKPTQEDFELFERFYRQRFKNISK